MIALVGSPTASSFLTPGFDPLTVPELTTVLGVSRGVVEAFYCEEKVNFRINLHPVFRLPLSPQKSLIQLVLTRPLYPDDPGSNPTRYTAC